MGETLLFITALCGPNAGKPGVKTGFLSEMITEGEPRRATGAAAGSAQRSDGGGSRLLASCLPLIN